jgi:DNA-binding NtrC family response regulator
MVSGSLDLAHIVANLVLNATLKARGASVTVASNADQLAAALAKQAYRAVLVDLSPIAENPERALAGIRSKLPQAKILIITGNVDALPATFGDHNIELVRKPFDIGEVLHVLTRPS